MFEFQTQLLYQLFATPDNYIFVHEWHVNMDKYTEVNEIFTQLWNETITKLWNDTFIFAKYFNYLTNESNKIYKSKGYVQSMSSVAVSHTTWIDYKE